MKRLLLRSLILFLGAALGAALAPRIAFLEAPPDVMLAIAVVGAITLNRNDSLVFAWTAGLAKDLFSTGALGASAFLFLLAAIGLRRLRGHYRLDALPLLFPVAAAIACGVGGAYLLGVLISFPHIAFWAALVRVPLEAISTAVAAIVLFAGLRLATRRPRHRFSGFSGFSGT